jgi:hypothetical protein
MGGNDTDSGARTVASGAVLESHPTEPALPIQGWQHLADLSRARLGLILSIACTASFGVFDIAHVAIIGDSDLAAMLALRIALLGFLVLGLARIHRRNPPISARELEGWTYGTILSVAAAISLMCLLTGGLESYYGTANLILMAGASYVPRPWWRTTPVAVLVVIFHAVIVLGGAALMPELSPQLHDAATLYRFLVFEVLLATSGLGIVGSAHLLYTLRQELGEYRSIGRYQLRRKLGSGGMGQVWAAWHKGLGREVAVKLLRFGLDDQRPDPVAIERFRREVRATSELVHPNTVRLYDYGATEDGILYYAMELLEGENLRTLVRREGPLPPARAVHLISQAARALAEAHRKGIVHRDVKPENVLVVDAGGEKDFVKLLDFGIVKVLTTPTDGGEEEDLTRTGMLTGTPATMSPEAITASEIGPPADVYSLGAVLYFLLAGRFPFEGEAASQLLAHLHEPVVRPSVKAGVEVPLDLEDVVLRALAKDPGDRYPDAGAFALALAHTRISGSWRPRRSEPSLRAASPSRGSSRSA